MFPVGEGAREKKWLAGYKAFRDPSCTTAGGEAGTNVAKKSVSE